MKDKEIWVFFLPLRKEKNVYKTFFFIYFIFLFYKGNKKNFKITK